MTRCGKMPKKKINLLISFDSLVESISELSVKDKHRLWRLLEGQLANEEEELWEQDPSFRAEIQEARAAYEAGDYVSIDEYLSHQCHDD